MAIDKILGNSDLDRVADSVFSAVNDSVSEIKAMQKRKAAENVQVVIQALKKIDADIREKYDGVTTVIEKRVASIKDGKDGRDGANGRDGKDGRPGRDGSVGPRGANGADGRNGRDGTDGVSVTDANIDFDGSLIISLSNGRTINVGEVVAPDLAERIKVITNGGGTSQSVLDTLASLQSQINALQNLGAVNYVGTWNASTNNPTIVAGTGDKGDYYVVSVAGSTNIDGQTLWGVGDWIIFNGSVWQRVDGGSTGNFTDLTTSGTVTHNGGTVNSVAYLNGSKVLTTGSALKFDGVNLGVGVTPSNWGVDYKNIDINDSSCIGATLDQLDVGYNFYYQDFDNNNVYKLSKGAARYTQRTPGQHVWYTAPVGTAGDGISFSQVMMLDQSGNLALGNNFPTAKLDVTGTAAISGAVTLSGGTANGVAYLNGSKVLTTGSALTFDGTNFTVATAGSSYSVGGVTAAISVGGSIRATGNIGVDSGVYLNAPTAAAMAFFTANAEQMRLTSTGLGIGTSSPVYQTQIYGSGQTTAALTDAGNKGGSLLLNTPTVSAGDGGALLLGAGGSGAKPFAAVKGLLSDGGGNTTGAIAFSTRNAIGDTALTERMRLNSSGNLGIGTSSPGYKLDVFSGTASSAVAQFTGVNTGRGLKISTALVNSVNDAGVILDAQQASGVLMLATGGTERARIDASGNLGIGTSSPGVKLDVVNASGRVARIGGFQFAGTGSSTDGGNNLLSSGVYWNGSNLTATQTSGAVLQFGNGALQFQTLSGLTAGSTYSFAPQLSLDSSGNLGLGVTPSAWSLGKGFEVGFLGNGVFSPSQGVTNIVNNTYYASSSYRYATTAAAAYYSVNTGLHQWFTAPSGTAGNAITFTQAMTLSAAGDLSVGTTTANTRFTAAGTGQLLNGTTRGVAEIVQDFTTKRGLHLGYDSSGQTGVIAANSAGAGSNLAFWTFSGSAWGERARIDSSGNLIQTVNTTAATLATNNTLTFSIVDNSTLRISVRGSDGTTRTATVALT
jgi:hypothetical protein